jgi:hypothetical protein
MRTSKKRENSLKLSIKVEKKHCKSFAKTKKIRKNRVKSKKMNYRKKYRFSKDVLSKRNTDNS